MRRPRPLLAATLIVRDEAHQLAGCLASLEGVVDEVVVYDTGSRDDTLDVARRAGARVLAGYWDDDFARARNAALGMTRAEWSLCVDADERLVADGARLRDVLPRAGPATGGRSGGRSRGPAPGGAPEGMLLSVVDRDADGLFQARHASLRLVRTAGARWDGRVHEVLTFARPGAVKVLLPASVALLEHFGYRDVRAVRAKAERNLALAQAELDALFACGSDDVGAGARVLLNLARSAAELGHRQMAVDALEAVREIMATGPQRTLATALLAQLLLDAGGFAEVALVLEAELRTDTQLDHRYVDWIRAQALTALDRPDEALALVRGIDRLVDAAGIERPLGPVLQARAALAARTGEA